MGWNGRLTLVLAVLGSCRAVTTSYTYPDDLTHLNYVKRTKAVRQFAVERDVSQLPAAFDLLLDDEDHIRSLAHEAIKAMSPDRNDFGYLSYLPESVRIGIVARWEAWWVAQQGAGEGRG